MIILIFAISVGSLGHVFLRIGMKAIGEFSFSAPSTWFPYFLQVITSYQIIFGVFLQALFFGAWLILLSKAELSLVLPLTAVEYILGAVFAYFILQEKISWMRLSGTMIVCLGVVLICLDQFQKEGNNPKIPTSPQSSVIEPHVP
jgi:drug/metabolite transporter (DMT)-like permease